MIVCPDCKKALEDYRCTACNTQFELVNQIPVLLSRDARYESARAISAAYDSIYTDHQQVWEDQGRTPEFIRFFAALIGNLSNRDLLEVGCGEGFLLKTFTAQNKTTIDISARAAKIAKDRTGAAALVAIAEKLPFADNSFDVVVSVGVMEHFIDDEAACRELGRVLRPGGHCVTLIHVHRTRSQELAQKIREFILPPRPIALVRWIVKKLHRRIHQPVMRKYTLESARECLTRGQLKMERIISLDTEPTAPLIGPHVVIYIAKKQ